jgi:6-pyruvoyltetrahydropterin/6-carboxytetrahydropterin synthase
MPEGALDEKNNSTELAEMGERTLHIGKHRPIRISAGHRILHHYGKCSRPHGHNYEIVVEVTGTLTEDGWVVDKGDVTRIISDWDHMFLLEEGDPLIRAFESSGDGDAVITIDHPPTAEVMSVILEERMVDQFPDNVSDVSVTVQETGQLSASH